MGSMSCLYRLVICAVGLVCVCVACGSAPAPDNAQGDWSEQDLNLHFPDVNDPLDQCHTLAMNVHLSTVDVVALVEAHDQALLTGDAQAIQASYDALMAVWSDVIDTGDTYRRVCSSGDAITDLSDLASRGLAEQYANCPQDLAPLGIDC